jgi:hypothetical protein
LLVKQFSKNIFEAIEKSEMAVSSSRKKFRYFSRDKLNYSGVCCDLADPRDRR